MKPQVLSRSQTWHRLKSVCCAFCPAAEGALVFLERCFEAKKVQSEIIKILGQGIQGYRPSARAHPHLSRHTFATDLLQRGVSLQVVSALLGHSSTKMTERRYSHWIKGRQENLEAEVKKTWDL